MDLNKIVNFMLVLLAFGNNVSSLILQTKDVIVNLQEDNSIILNCTYHIAVGERILDGGIRWQKEIDGIFKEIALFSHPGGLEPFIPKDMQTLYKHRTELIAPNTTLAAVMIIKDPVCYDKGIYQCQIKFILPPSEKYKTSSVVVEFSAKAQEPDEFLLFPKHLEENQSISLMCSADVGGPRGNISIWRISQNSDTPKLIYKSNFTNTTTENCTDIINVTTTYTVTKEDDGALFRCSSQNNLTQGQEPSKESSRIIVIYGPSNTRITASISNSRAFIGDHVNMECIADGSPSPNYTWKFNFTDAVSNAKYNFSANKSRLSFTITNTTDSGYYQCVASIYFKGQWYNSSSSVNLTVQEKSNEVYPLELEKPCNENTCLSVQNCVVKKGHAFCSVNIWIVIAIVFIILTLISCTTTLGFVLVNVIQRRKTLLTTNEMDMGGYLSPVEEATGSSYEALGQDTVHVYSTMQNRDLFGHGSNYEDLGQGTVHVYSTMQNRD